MTNFDHLGSPHSFGSFPILQHFHHIRHFPQFGSHACDHCGGYPGRNSASRESRNEPTDLLGNQFVSRTRNSQKNMNAKGARAGTNRIGDPRMNFGMTPCCPRKKKAAAKNSAKHMRQRCRAIRGAPEIPPRRITLRSMADANAAKDAKTKNGTYEPGGALGIFAARKPKISRATATPKTAVSAPFSNNP